VEGWSEENDKREEKGNEETEWRAERGSEENGVRLKMGNEEKYQGIGKESKENIGDAKRK